MKKGVWLGGALLCLGGWVGSATAQTTWNPAPAPAAAVAPARPAPAAAPGWQPSRTASMRGQAPDDPPPVPLGSATQFASEREARLGVPVAQQAPGEVQPAVQTTVAMAGQPEPSGIVLAGASDLPGVPLPLIGSSASSVPVAPARPPAPGPSEANPSAPPPPPPLVSLDLVQATLPLASPPAEVVPAPGLQAPLSTWRPQPAALPAADQPTLPAPRPEPTPTPASFLPPVNPGLSFHPNLESPDPWDTHGRDNFYLRTEYLLWWIKNDHVPALFTTSNATDMGVLGAPSTQVLFQGTLDRNPFSGARVTAGFWLDCDHDKALEVEGFLLGQQQASFVANSNTYPVISRPFYDVVNNMQAVERLAFPGLATGTGSVTAPSSLWGISPDLRCKLCCGCDYQIDGLVGVRYLELDERVQINENIMATAAAPAPFTNANASLTDSFATRNQFVGGEVGLAGEKFWGPWVLDFRAKVALGGTDETLTINGYQQIVNRVTGQVTNFQGGLLALNSNIGRYSRESFAVVPELNFHLGYQLTDHIRASVGYDLLYWSSVIRPGDQIDTGLDINRIPNFIVPPGTPTVNRPAVPFKETDFFATGLTFSLEFTF